MDSHGQKFKVKQAISLAISPNVWRFPIHRGYLQFSSILGWDFPLYPIINHPFCAYCHFRQTSICGYDYPSLWDLSIISIIHGGFPSHSGTPSSHSFWIGIFHHKTIQLWGSPHLSAFIWVNSNILRDDFPQHSMIPVGSQ